jgi:hypothetical protein
MPEQRLQRCRDAYVQDVSTYRITEANQVPLPQTSAAYRITQAQLAADAKDERV